MRTYEFRPIRPVANTVQAFLACIIREGGRFGHRARWSSRTRTAGGVRRWIGGAC